MSIIVQYVLVRGDLLKTLNWPVGAVMAQALHASTAVIHMFYNDPVTQSYFEDLDHMHKIVLEPKELIACQAYLVQEILQSHELAKAPHLSWKIFLAATTLPAQITKDVYCIVPNEETLKKISEKLNENCISHKLWIEQPENIATCLALKPFPKEEVQKYFKKLKLFS